MASTITSPNVWHAIFLEFGIQDSTADDTTFASLDATQGDAVAISQFISSPVVQQVVIPVIQIIQLATGSLPNPTQLKGWVAAAQANGLLSVAQAWVNNSNFQAQFGTTSTSIILGIYAKAFGVVPTQAQINAWSVDTPAQILENFAVSTIFTNTSAPFMNVFLTSVIESVAGQPGAVFPSGSLFSLALPPTPQFITLTNAQDSVISGAATIGTTTPGVTVQTTGDVTVNAPLTGPFGNQPSLTSADVIKLQGAGNSLNATFNGGSTVSGVTIQGAQSWTINQAGGGTVTITGVPGAIDGLTSLTFNGNGVNAENLTVGNTGAGIDATTAASGFSLNISNVASTPVTGVVNVFFAPTSFHGGDTINVNVNAVTNTLGGTVTSQAAALFVNAGGSNGTAGFTNWVVNSTGANSINDIALSSLGSTAARSLKVTDDGSTTIIWRDGGAAEWAGLQVVDASGTTGNLTITGAETANGLLSGDATALTTVFGGSGADSFDLSAYAGTTAQVAGLSVNGGGNAGTVVELSNSEINTISTVGSNAFALWTGVPTLWDVGTGGGNGAVGGAFNMADFPGTLTVSLRSNTSGLNPDQTANIVVTKAPDGLNFNFNLTDQHHFNFSVTGSDTAGGAGNVVNVNYSDLTFFDSLGTFSSQNFDFVNVNFSGTVANSQETFYFGGITLIANTDAAETFNVNSNLTNVGEVFIGQVSGDTLGTTNIELLGGAVVVHPPTAQFSLTGTLNVTGSNEVIIGVTNASTIHSTTTGHFLMDSPDDINLGTSLWVAGNHVTVSATSAGSLLQGTLIGTGPAALTPGSGVDSLTDTAGGSSFFGDGGADNITIGHGGNNVLFGEFNLGTSGAHQQTVDDATGHAFLGFWGATSNGQAISGVAGSIFGGASGGTSADMTTVNGFTIGSGGDALTFMAASFGGGLVDPATSGAISPVPTTAAGDAFAVGFAGEHIPTAGQLVRIVLDEVTNFSNASSLASALHTATVGNIVLDSGVAAHSSEDFLIAYEVANTGNTAINIAEVHLVNTTGATQHDTANMNVYVQDLVQLANISFGLTALGVNAGEIHFS